MDNYSEIINAVAAIKEDPKLKASFIKILEVGSMTHATRVEKIREAIAPMNPPTSVTKMLTVLKNDKMAAMVLNALKA